MVNRFYCVGNLVRDPETKKVGDANITKFAIAVNGYKENDVSFFTCIAFGKSGDAISKYMKKGSRVFVEGALHTRTYEDKAKEKHFITEVIVEKCEFLNSKKEKEDDIPDFPNF